MTSGLSGNAIWHRGRVLLTAAVLAGVVAILASAVAVAALFLELDRDSARPGATIHGRTGGQGAFAQQGSGSLDVYFMRENEADGVNSPGDAGLVRIGTLKIDSAGDGRLTFTVPRVAPGVYVLFVHCPPCAPFSAGRVMAQVADFRVLGAPDTSVAESSRSAFFPGSQALVMGIVFAASLVVTLRARAERVRRPEAGSPAAVRPGSGSPGAVGPSS